MALSLRIKKSRFKNRSKASKANWAKVPKEERSKRMRKLAKDRQARMTAEEKKVQANWLLAGRQKSK